MGESFLAVVYRVRVTQATSIGPQLDALECETHGRLTHDLPP